MSGPAAQTLRTRALNDALAASLITGTLNHHAPRVPCWTFQSHPEGLKHVKSTRDTRNGKSSWNHKFEGWHVPAQTPDQADVELFFEQILTFELQQTQHHTRDQFDGEGNLVDSRKSYFIDGEWSKHCTILTPALNGEDTPHGVVHGMIPELSGQDRRTCRLHAELLHEAIPATPLRQPS